MILCNKQSITHLEKEITMENEIVSTTNAVLNKKIEGYHFADENFVAPQELTVTITLAEYRNLVGKVATAKADIDEANSKRYKVETEIKQLNNNLEALKQENAELKSEVYKLNQRLQPTCEDKSNEQE